MQQIFLKFSSAFRKHEESMLYSRAGIIGILRILLAALATSLISRVVCHDHQTKIERMNKFERSWFLHRARPRKRTTPYRSDETRARPQERCGIFIFRLERIQEWVESKQSDTVVSRSMNSSPSYPMSMRFSGEQRLKLVLASQLTNIKNQTSLTFFP